MAFFLFSSNCAMNIPDFIWEEFFEADLSLEIVQFHNIIFRSKSSFANSHAHEEDFDIPAEWHFHGTAHSKGACDGIGNDSGYTAIPRFHFYSE